MYPIQFGYCLPIFASPGAGLFRTPNYASLDTATTMKLGRLADTLGYDSLWVADHLMLGKDQAILEGWTVLAALAGSTQKARLGMIHQAHFFRNPALVAKMAATVDLISGGRFIYFVDVGFSRHEYAAYGLPWQDAYEDRFASMIEGLQVTLKLWGAEKPVSFDGQFYQVKEAVCTPLPIQRPHPPVWLGEAHPLTMEGAARYAQGWNSVPVRREELQRRLDALAAACGAIGRPVEEIEKSLEIQILIAPDHDAIRSRLKAITALTPPGANIKPQADLLAFVNGESDTLPSSLTDTSIVGTPDEVRTQVEGYIKMGFTHFMLWFMDAPSEDGLRLFAEATAPHFKAS